MVVCPVCDSRRIILIVSPERRAFCPSCGSRWNQKKGWSSVQSAGAASAPHAVAMQEDPNPAA
jgi:hypothetical protein